MSASTNATDGVDLSEEYIIDNNFGDVMSESFGDSEANYTNTEAAGISALAQQKPQLRGLRMLWLPAIQVQKAVITRILKPQPLVLCQ